MNTTYFDTAEGGVTAGVTAGVKTCLCDVMSSFFFSGLEFYFLDGSSPMPTTNHTPSMVNAVGWKIGNISRHH